MRIEQVIKAYSPAPAREPDGFDCDGDDISCES
jgi:hypothetical protein